MSTIPRLFFCLFMTASIGPMLDRERLEEIEDNTPLSRSAEKSAWDYLFDILRRSSQAELDTAVFAEVGFVELSRQPKEYRGRIVTVHGRLLRCDFIPERQKPSPVESPKAPAGFYESWILLNDEKRIPISICSLGVPDSLPLGDDLNEQVEVTGFFYKRRLFLSAEGEEVTTPTLLAKSFRWFPDAKNKAAPQRPARWINQYFGQILIVLIVMWMALRTLCRRTARQLRRSVEPECNGKIVIPGETDRKEVATPDVLVFAVLLGSATIGLAEEPPGINANFAKMLLRMDDIAWDTLGDETIPLEQQQEEVFGMMNDLRNVPRGFLKREASPLPISFSHLTGEPNTYRGQAFQLRGTATFVEELPLNPVQQRTFRLPTFFRCRLLVAGHCVELLTPTVPAAWKRNESIHENVAAVGIYIKRLPMNETAEDYSGVPPTSPAPYDPFGDRTVPLFVAPGVEWYPDTLLGNLGMDVGSLDQIPVLRTADLKKKTLNLAEPLRLLDRSEIIRRAFNFTEADRAPFYGLLRAAANAPKGRLRNLAATSTQRPVVSLFTEPDKHRSELVLLHGTAKRVIPTLVDDKEIQELHGITRYYQIYFYTDDSQGNPLVACVTELPKGMPVGSGGDYSERISIAGFFYKLWIYESSEIVEKEGKEGAFHKPTFAPLLIGRSPDWYPKKRTASPPQGEHWTTLSFATFGCLAVCWYFLRRFRRTKPIEFRLGATGNETR